MKNTAFNNKHSTLVEASFNEGNEIVRKKIVAFILARKPHLTKKIWLETSTKFVDHIIFKSNIKKNCYTKEQQYWTAYAVSLLESCRATSGFIDISDDEVLYQLLGAMGKCFVFGVYHGNIINLPRRTALRIMRNNFGRYAVSLLRSGLSPKVVTVHLPVLQGKKLSPELNVESHLKIAELLEQEPNLQGVYGASWYYDPKVSRISPNLKFLRDFSLLNGAMIFKVGPDKAAIADAICKSQTRKKLYQKGLYCPTRYARYWPREEFLKWASKYFLL